MSKNYTYVVGYKDNLPYIVEWDFDGDKFSMCGQIGRGNRCHTAGQCIDEIANAFPLNTTIQDMREIWKRWHLNDMKAGSPQQRKHLESFPEDIWRDSHNSHYEWACDILEEADLLHDKNFIHNDEPYRYGSAWLKEEIPLEVAEKIRSWERYGAQKLG